jgi:hypothetical protein
MAAVVIAAIGMPMRAKSIAVSMVTLVMIIAAMTASANI